MRRDPSRRFEGLSRRVATARQARDHWSSVIVRRRDRTPGDDCLEVGYVSRSESLFYAVALLSASAVFFRVLFVGSRLSREPWWVRERWLCDVWVPIMLIALSFGVDFSIAAAGGKGALLGDLTLLAYATCTVTFAAGAWYLLGRLLPAAGRDDDAGRPRPTRRIRGSRGQIRRGYTSHDKAA